MSNDQLERELIGLYKRVAKLATVMREGFDTRDKGWQLLKQKQEEMDKHLDLQGAELTELKEQVKKLKKLVGESE